MLQNYLKTAWRNLTRNKAFSLINILGLALGLACSLLIFLWVQDERNTDRFTTGNNTYSVYERIFSEGKVEAGYYSPGMLATELKRVMPGIKYTAPFWSMGPSLFETAEKRQKMNGAYAGADYFKIFSYPLLQGRADMALSELESMSISRKMAENFFGSPAAAIGKTIR